MAGMCDRVKECEFYNVIDHLVCWLAIVYNVCISHIGVFSLGPISSVCRSLFPFWCKCDECSAKFDFISRCVSAFIRIVYHVLKDLLYCPHWLQLL